MPDGKKDPARVRTGRHGGLKGWSNTEDRYARMARVRENSPASDSYWARKLGFTNPKLTPEQRKKIQTERKLYFAELRVGSVKAIKLKKEPGRYVEHCEEETDHVSAGEEDW
ncbi:hypothetical protein [Mycobacterium sp.]|uniref:hypothetical protein n=1 Tax=Mycobacterium sp. TaxID=1785 RepID=UPI003C756CAE